jgi:pimeloyl-ACP methyl ester carboxylesterase
MGLSSCVRSRSGGFTGRTVSRIAGNHAGSVGLRRAPMAGHGRDANFGHVRETADPVVPLRHAETLAALMPNARFVAIDGGGHIPLTDHRVEVEGEVRAFLQSL